MADPDLSCAEWRKSTRSGGNGGACVEVAAVQRTIAVRDSKSPDGPVLLVTPDAWRTFTDDLKSTRSQDHAG